MLKYVFHTKFTFTFYLPPVLAIISGKFLKFLKVSHYKCSFYEIYNIPTIFKVIKNDEVIKMYGAQCFLLILFEWLY